jgi:hypothetical protein
MSIQKQTEEFCRFNEFYLIETKDFESNCERQVRGFVFLSPQQKFRYFDGVVAGGAGRERGADA